MPLVYACICPHAPVLVPEVGPGREAEVRRTVEAMRRVAEEMASFQPETAVVVTSHGPAQQQAFGLLAAPSVEGDFSQWGAPEVRFAFDTDVELAERIQREAAQEDVPVTSLRRWDGGLDWGCTVPLYYLREALAGARPDGRPSGRLLPMTISWLGPRFHFDFGRAVGRALAAYERRVVFICSADLSHALQPGTKGGYDPAGHVFDERYRRTIEQWDVKWLVHLEPDFRRHAAEDAVPQTAVLMGALSGYRIQPRVLSYEGPFGVGYLVAAIDVLGPRHRGEEQQ